MYIDLFCVNWEGNQFSCSVSVCACVCVYVSFVWTQVKGGNINTLLLYSVTNDKFRQNNYFTTIIKNKKK